MTRFAMVSLSDVLQLDLDEVQVDRATEYQAAGVRSFGRGLFVRPPVSGATSSYSKLFRLHVDQVVLSRLFAWEGAVALVSPEFDGWYVSPEFPTFTVNVERALPSLIGHFISWERFHEDLAGSTRGLGQRRQRVHVEEFLDLTIPLPAIDEQGRVTARLDAVADAARRAAEAVGRVGADHFASLLAGLIDSIVDRKSVGKVVIGEVADFVSDTIHPGEDPSPATSFVGLQHVESHTGRRIGSDSLEQMKGRKFRFQPGDVLYGYLRPYLNKVWVADRHGLCSVDQYVLRPRAGVDGALLAHCLRGSRVLTQAIDLTHSLQLPRLRSGLLAALEVPVVAKADVQLVVGHLDSLRDRIVRATANRQHQEDLLGALLPSALNEAFGLS